jgi:hypothetical protein
MEEKIRDWLVNSGYPLELFVYQNLQARGYLCGKSEYYKDLESGTSREIDVIAYKHGENYETYSYDLNLIFECKKSSKPLINLCTSESEQPIGFHYLAHGEQEDGPSANYLALYQLKKLNESQLEKAIGVFSAPAPLGYSLVSALGASDANIYSGLIGLAKASTFYRRSFLKFFWEARKDRKAHVVDRNPFQFHMAVLVVDASLFNATLLRNGDLSIRPSKWSVLKIPLPWDVNPHEIETGYCIHVVVKDFFPEFLGGVDQLYRYVSQDSIVSPMCIRNTSIAQRIKNALKGTR